MDEEADAKPHQPLTPEAAKAASAKDEAAVLQEAPVVGEQKDDTVPLSSSKAQERPTLKNVGFSGLPPAEAGGISEAKSGAEDKLREYEAVPDEKPTSPASGQSSQVLSSASRFTTFAPSAVSHFILKFTTLSDGNEKASFRVDRSGGTIGRSHENTVCVPSDSTLAKHSHARLLWHDEQLFLQDESQEYHAAVRVGVGQAQKEWPLTRDVVFSAGNSIFVVQAVDLVDPENPTLTLHVRTGPKKGAKLIVRKEGATLGRANDNTVCIPDRELSRRHSKITFEAANSAFHVSDLGSTNGTYVQLVGPYHGRYPLNLNDHILVGRTGFSVNRFDYGISEETGFRRTMEDKCLIVQDMSTPGLSSRLTPQTWMGVYDGHGGPEASLFLFEHLHHLVSESLSSASDTIRQAQDTQAVPHLDEAVESAVTNAFVKADRQFISGSSAQAGSTATTLLLLGNRAYCANVGDSRTVLCRRGEAIAMSNDHKPSREDEAVRIKAAGGFIINKRVMGELAVSRAFGDSEFKKGISEILGEEAANMRDDNAEQDLSKPLVIAEPEFMAIDLEPTDDFLLLACDGLFDVMTNQAACDMINAEMRQHGDAQRAAETLTRTAIDQYGSRDNVTVLIALLRRSWS